MSACGGGPGSDFRFTHSALSAHCISLGPPQPAHGSGADTWSGPTIGMMGYGKLPPSAFPYSAFSLLPDVARRGPAGQPHRSSERGAALSRKHLVVGACLHAIQSADRVQARSYTGHPSADRVQARPYTGHPSADRVRARSGGYRSSSTARAHAVQLHCHGSANSRAPPCNYADKALPRFATGEGLNAV